MRDRHTTGKTQPVTATMRETNWCKCQASGHTPGEESHSKLHQSVLKGARGAAAAPNKTLLVAASAASADHTTRMHLARALPCISSTLHARVEPRISQVRHRACNPTPPTLTSHLIPSEFLCRGALCCHRVMPVLFVGTVGGAVLFAFSYACLSCYFAFVGG